MEALKENRSVALEVLLGRYWSPLVAFARGFVHSTDAAEDVAQETFVRLWEFRSKWEPTGSPRSFLFRVARNLALNEERTRRTRWSRRRELSADRQVQVRVATPAEALEEKNLRQVVEAAIAALPERRREIFVLARYHNLSYREIADTLEISPQTVANQMSAALMALRESLGAHGPA